MELRGNWLLFAWLLIALAEIFRVVIVPSTQLLKYWKIWSYEEVIGDDCLNLCHFLTKNGPAKSLILTNLGNLPRCYF